MTDVLGRPLLLRKAIALLRGDEFVRRANSDIQKSGSRQIKNPRTLPGVFRSKRGELVELVVHADPGNVATIVRVRVNIQEVLRRAADFGDVERLVQTHGAKIVVEGARSLCPSAPQRRDHQHH